MKHIVFITGGGRSGKSRYALQLASQYDKKAFIATAEPIDEEMQERIARHRRERGESFITIEEPLDLAGAVGSLPPEIDVAVIDCLTVWLGNLMHRREVENQEFPELSAFIDALKDPPCDLIIIANEVGMGIIPHNEMARRFRDLAGGLNQKVAGLASRVVLMVSGIPLAVKEETP